MEGTYGPYDYTLEVDVAVRACWRSMVAGWGRWANTGSVAPHRLVEDNCGVGRRAGCLAALLYQNHADHLDQKGNEVSLAMVS